jgi:dynein heavy chain
MEKIDKFNEEEAAFHWEYTQYPLRKEIADCLAPYKKLYDVACDFLTKHEKWITATIGFFDPEEIDNDVSLCFRLLYFYHIILIHTKV